MCVKMARLPITAAITFMAGYFLYYGVILCAAPLFTVNSCLFGVICPLNSSNWRDVSAPSIQVVGHTLTPNLMLLFLTTLPMVFYACMFVLDAVWCRIILHVKEDISLPRNVIHWLLVGPALVLYSLTQLHGYNVLALKGKVGACVHQLAGKATLGTGAGLGGDIVVASAAASSSPNRAASASPTHGTAATLADAVFEQESHALVEAGIAPAQIQEAGEVTGYD
jgi:hypothetical protein